jgi:hypothetical protein
MKTIPDDLAAHLAGGATSLCRCWKLIRRDGQVLGFTDHDRDLSFGGLTFAARTGLEAAEAAAELGFAVGGGDVAPPPALRRRTSRRDSTTTRRSRPGT